MDDRLICIKLLFSNINLVTESTDHKSCHVQMQTTTTRNENDDHYNEEDTEEPDCSKRKARAIERFH